MKYCNLLSFGASGGMPGFFPGTRRLPGILRPAARN
jgi:hypothetical protein